MRKCPITFTDARPGFVDTDLLADGKSYPFKMNVTDVASTIVKGIETKKRVLVIDWNTSSWSFSGVGVAVSLEVLSDQELNAEQNGISV